MRVLGQGGVSPFLITGDPASRPYIFGRGQPQGSPLHFWGAGNHKGRPYYRYRIGLPHPTRLHKRLKQGAGGRRVGVALGMPLHANEKRVCGVF